GHRRRSRPLKGQTRVRIPLSHHRLPFSVLSLPNWGRTIIVVVDHRVPRHAPRVPLLEDRAAHAPATAMRTRLLAPGTHRPVIPHPTSWDPTVRRPDRHESLPLGRGEESEPHVAS